MYPCIASLPGCMIADSALLVAGRDFLVRWLARMLLCNVQPLPLLIS
jgi:hypothetical protein